MVEIKRIAGKKVVVLMGIVIGTAFLAVLFFLILSPGVNQVTHSEVSLNIQDPPINQTDLVMPLFRVTKNPNDFIEFENWSADSQFAEAPPEKECPADAEKALEPFGGMPRDAVFDSIKDASNGCIGNDYGEKCFVTSRMIVYRQKPYGMTIHGKAGGMMIELTAGGFPSRISKQWLTLEESGIDHIIPASEAMTRLRHGEGINVPPGPLDLTILSVEPAYYTPENLSNESYLEPVWAFNARDEIHQNALTLYVPAEKIPPSVELIPESGPGMSPNFTETGGTIPIADVSSASHVYVGTSGPVGEDAARESIRLFTA
ncbi:MAG TPA: hypothetical protein VEI81_01795, partial [Methanoregula sp.]|nr:hypothetical protein [Methanoregula sp.]